MLAVENWFLTENFSNLAHVDECSFDRCKDRWSKDDEEGDMPDYPS